MPFDKKVPGHKASNAGRPRMFPDGYSYETLKAGFEATTFLRKAPALVDMGKDSSRDNALYKHLDEKYIKEVKKELHKKKLGLNDHIPNSLKRDGSMSGISSTDVGSAILNHNRSRTTMLGAASVQ